MPKYKAISKKEQKAENDIYSIRTVTKQDKWCRFHSDLARKMNEEAPYGYVVIIPNYKAKAYIDLEFYGKVIKTMICNKTLYLQVSATRKAIEEYMKKIYVINFRKQSINKKVKTKKGKRNKKVSRNILNISRNGHII